MSKISNFYNSINENYDIGSSAEIGDYIKTCYYMFNLFDLYNDICLELEIPFEYLKVFKIVDKKSLEQTGPISPKFSYEAENIFGDPIDINNRDICKILSKEKYTKILGEIKYKIDANKFNL